MTSTVTPQSDNLTPSARAGHAWNAVRVAAAIVAMTVAVFLPLAVLLPLSPWLRTLPQTPSIGVVSSVVISVLAVLSYLLVTFLLARFIDRSTLRRSGLRVTPRSVPAFLAALTLTVVIVVGVGAVLQAAGLLRPGEPLDPTVPVWYTIIAALLAGFALQGFGEELLWRGYVLRHLRTRLTTAIWISAAGFAVMHLVSEGGQQNVLERVLYLAGPFGFALLAGAFAARTRELWAAVAVHGGVHTASLVNQFVGIGDGPVLWVAYGLALTAVAVVLMRRIPKDRSATGLHDA